MIAINSLSKNYGKKVLFENISLHINRGEKIGLIGPNGSGKSTFFHLLLGEIEPSSGTIQIQKNIRIGYLPQEASFRSEHTVLQELTQGDDIILALKKEKEELEEENGAASKRYGDILHELDVLGFFSLEHKAKKILAGLGFKESDFSRPILQMSGGWQMRALLAKLLVYHYDILLLDEPTNYLDLNAALWLKDYLAGFDGTFIMISHDKAFLTDVTNYTLILERGSIAKVSGNYEHYERIKEEKRVHTQKQFDNQEKKRQQLKRFVSRFHAQPNKAAAVRNKRKTLERMEEIDLPAEARSSIKNFSFPAARKSGHRVITLEGVSKSYGELKVYQDFDFEVTQGEKAVLTGENGAGKSTLLKILAGAAGFDQGERRLGHNIDIGYFSQTRMDTLNPANTVLEEAYAAAPGSLAQETIRTILGAFLFTGDDVEKRVSVLSGGEKSRLNLAKFLINPPNFLLLDEPTTHLDVDAVDALIRALAAYEGTLVFISHDIYFVRSTANVVYEVTSEVSTVINTGEGTGKKDRVRKFYGNFDYYLEKRQLEERAAAKQNNLQTKPRKASPGDSALNRVKEEQCVRRPEQEQRSAHNALLGAKMSKLHKETEALKLESYAKARALTNQRIWRDQETVKTYGRRLKEIENRQRTIEAELKQLTAQKIV